MTNPEESIGVATCGHCQKRYRILKKHARVVGKEIQCPKCHRNFIVTLQAATPLEQAAVQQAAESKTNETPEATATANTTTAAKKVRQRKKKTEIKTSYYSHIRNNFPVYFQRLKAMQDAESSSEEQVRVWCIDVLRSVLGYDDQDIDTEMTALGQRIDIAIKHNGKVLVVIECKNIRNKLPTATRDQAANYAASKSADWALIINGPIWKLYRIIPVKGHDPQIVEVFDIALFDEDGLSDYDVECFYLLTKRALTKSDSESMFHRRETMNDRRMLAAINDPKVVRSLAKILANSYRKEHDVIVKLDSEDVRERLQELFRPADL